MTNPEIERGAALLAPYAGPSTRRVLSAAVDANVGLEWLGSGRVLCIAPVTVPPLLERALWAHRQTVSVAVDPRNLKALWDYPSDQPPSPRLTAALAWLAAEICTFDEAEFGHWCAFHESEHLGASPFWRALAVTLTVVAGRSGPDMQATVRRILQAAA